MQYHEIGKTGMKVSSLSFGASSLGGVFHDIKEKEGIESVYEFYRCFSLLWAL